MALNDLERRNSLILRFSPNSIDFQTYYVTVVEYRPILSVKYHHHRLFQTQGP